MAEPILTPEFLAAAAAEPVESSSDGQQARAHSLKDLIAAAQYEAAATAVANRRSAWRGVRAAIGVPPGANGR